MRRLVIVLGAVLALAAPATASAACEDRDAEPVFSAWGDDADYFPAPGGLFDGDLQWTATGAAAVIEQANPFAVDETDITSLSMPAATSVTSPTICISRAHPFLRYVAHAEDRTKPKLGLVVLYNDDKGKPKRVPIADLDAKHFPDWSLTKPVDLKKVLPPADHVRSIQLRFLVGPGTGTWFVDNVFVDPVKKG